ncbi:hypothetical protein P3S67_004606 [Capsicum chacoense]
MAASTKLAVVLVILSLFCIGTHALKGCPFKALNQQHWNSISIDHRQQLSIHVNNNTRIVIGETPHDIDFFTRHDQWLKNQVITMEKEKSTDNNDYNNFYIVGFIVVVILAIINLLRVDHVAHHAPRECPFKSMYRKYGRSMMSSSTALGVIGETHHDHSTLFDQHQWLKNHVRMMQKKM